MVRPGRVVAAVGRKRNGVVQLGLEPADAAGHDAVVLLELADHADERESGLVPLRTGRGRTADADPRDVQAPLLSKGVPPGEHLLDAGYVDADLVVHSRLQHGIEIVGPMRPNSSWQAHSPDRYDLSQFTINWPTRTVTCPQGRTSTSWTPHPDAWGNEVITVKFLPH